MREKMSSPEPYYYMWTLMNMGSIPISITSLPGTMDQLFSSPILSTVKSGKAWVDPNNYQLHFVT